MGNLYSVLRSVYQSGNQTALLNDGDYFLQQVAAYYEPGFKFDCQLIERAVRQGAGNIVYQYIQQNRIPTASETATFLQQMQNRADFSATQAERAVGYLYYMVGWNEDGTINTVPPYNAPSQPPRPSAPPQQPFPSTPSPALSQPARPSAPPQQPLHNSPGPAPSQSVRPSAPPKASSQAAKANPSESRSTIRDFLSSRAGHIILTIILYVVYMVAIAAIILWAGPNETLRMPVILSIMVITTYFGWKALTRIEPRMFLFMPGLGWAMFFGLKTSLSFFIGWFVTPWQFAKMIIRKL